MRARLKVSRHGVELIKSFEGLRQAAARLPDGRWTLGYGHTFSAKEGARVTPQDAEALLRFDLLPIMDAINNAVLVPLNQNQFDALVSFAFNIGIDNFAKSNVLRRINEGRFTEAALAMDSWRSAEFNGQTYVLAPLIRRRAAEKNLFLTPDSEGLHPDEVGAPSMLVRPVEDLRVESATPTQRPSEMNAPSGGDVLNTRPLGQPDSAPVTGYIQPAPYVVAPTPQPVATSMPAPSDPVYFDAPAPETLSPAVREVIELSPAPTPKPTIVRVADVEEAALPLPSVTPPGVFLSPPTPLAAPAFQPAPQSESQPAPRPTPAAVAAVANMFGSPYSLNPYSQPLRAQPQNPQPDTAAQEAAQEAARLEATRQAALLEEQQRAEQARLEQIRQEQARLEAERLEHLRAEAERLQHEREREERERAEHARLEAERLEAQRIENERLEAERLENERLEQVRLARLEQERLEQRLLEEAQAAQLRAAQIEAERAEAARLESEQAAKLIADSTTNSEAARIAEEKRKSEAAAALMRLYSPYGNRAMAPLTPAKPQSPAPAPVEAPPVQASVQSPEPTFTLSAQPPVAPVIAQPEPVAVQVAPPSPVIADPVVADVADEEDGEEEELTFTPIARPSQLEPPVVTALNPYGSPYRGPLAQAQPVPVSRPELVAAPSVVPAPEPVAEVVEVPRPAATAAEPHWREALQRPLPAASTAPSAMAAEAEADDNLFPTLRPVAQASTPDTEADDWLGSGERIALTLDEVEDAGESWWKKLMSTLMWIFISGLGMACIGGGVAAYLKARNSDVIRQGFLEDYTNLSAFISAFGVFLIFVSIWLILKRLAGLKE